MILPILTYGQPSLREPAPPVAADSPELQALVDDMVETMRGAHGIGLAAPQVGRPVRLFVVERSAVEDDEGNPLPGPATALFADGAAAFINPEILEESARGVDFEEGCLSIPDLRELVVRPDRVRVRFLDRHFQPHELELDGLLARVFQHELDHLDGVLFVDHLSSLKRRLLGRRLREMAAGYVEAEYPVAPVGTPVADANPVGAR